MKRILSFAAAIVIALSLVVSAAAYDDAEIVKLDKNTTYQTIDGFGASYTWYLGWAVNNNQSETIWDWTFNDTEFNIIRFRDLNEIRNPDEAKQAEEGYKEYYTVYSAALERGIDPTVLVTSWGEYRRDLPWVAYTEKSDSGYSYYTLAKDENGEYMYDELAQFCVQSVKYFFDAGIPVDYFSISNEVELQERHVDENGEARDEAGFFFGQEEDDYHCCYWKAHIAVYNAFKEAFGEFAPKLIGAETMAAWPDLISGYLDPVFENCPESVEVVGHHLYGMEDYGGFEPKNFNAVYEASKGRRMWMTEWYNKNYFDHAGIIIDELINENLSAYLYWDGVWRFNQGSCIIEVGDSPDSEIKRMGNHYIMMHFSKFIKKGYQRIDVSEELGSKIAAFKSPDGSKVVIVAANTLENGEFLRLDAGEDILDSHVWQSVEGESEFGFDNEYMQDMGEFDDELWLPARSLTTIEIGLTADPNYVEPAVEEKVNPFVKTRSSGMTSVLIAVGAAIAVIIVAALIIAAVTVTKHTKKLKQDNAEE